MKLDPKIAEAARSEVGPGMFETDKQANARARRVLKAASECVPDEVVFTIQNKLAEMGRLIPASHLRAGLSAGLAKWAEEE